MTLTYQGGKVGSDEIVAAEQPTFQMGKRYVIFAYPNGGGRANAWIPIVGLYLGYFPVGPEHGSGNAVVHNWAGYPIARIEHNRLVLVNSQDESVPPQSAVGTLHRGARTDQDGPPPPEPRPAPLMVPTPNSSRPVERLPSPPTRYNGSPNLPARPGSANDKGAWILLRKGQDPGTRLSEEQFLQAIKSVL